MSDKPETSGAPAPVKLDDTLLDAAVGGSLPTVNTGGVNPCVKTIVPCVKTFIPCIKVIRST